MAKIVCLDPGHGGRDPGALGITTQEKANNLIFCLKLGGELQRHGVLVKYTRTTDKDFCSGSFSDVIDLENRIIIAKSYNPDIFISCHNNSFNKNAKGLETFCYKFGGTDQKLANDIHSKLSTLPFSNRGVKSGNLYVLRKFDKTSTDACLIEYGFIDSEEKLILDNMNNAVILAATGILKNIGIEYKKETDEVIDVLTHAIAYHTVKDFSTALIIADKLGNCATFCCNANPVIHPEAKLAKHLIKIGGPKVEDHPNVTNCCGYDAPETAILAAKYAQTL